MPEVERRDMRLLLWSKRFLDSLSSETTLSLWRRIGSSEGVRLLLMGESSVRRVTLYFSALRSGPTQPAQAPIFYD